MHGFLGHLGLLDLGEPVADVDRLAVFMVQHGPKGSVRPERPEGLGAHGFLCTGLAFEGA